MKEALDEKGKAQTHFKKERNFRKANTATTYQEKEPVTSPPATTPIISDCLGEEWQDVRITVSC
jgi:hypothetical protein